MLEVHDDGGIILDKTVFYVTGGGQPGDSGVLKRAEGTPIEIARQCTVTATRSFMFRWRVLGACSGASPSWRALIGNGDTDTCVSTQGSIY